MAYFSLNNGLGDHWYSPDDITNLWDSSREGETLGKCILSYWDAIVQRMDDDTREAVSDDLAPCTECEFLAEYLRRAPEDLILG